MERATLKYLPVTGGGFRSQVLKLIFIIICVRKAQWVNLPHEFKGRYEASEQVHT